MLMSSQSSRANTSDYQPRLTDGQSQSNHMAMPVHSRVLWSVFTIVTSPVH